MPSPNPRTVVQLLDLAGYPPELSAFHRSLLPKAGAIRILTPHLARRPSGQASRSQLQSVYRHMPGSPSRGLSGGLAGNIECKNSKESELKKFSRLCTFKK
jgi:hypothetical protein